MGPARSITLTAALLAMLAAGAIAGAQVPSLGDQQQRLRAANAGAAAAEARAKALDRAAAAARDQAAQAQAQQAAAAERIAAAQAEIAAAHARIAIIDRLLAAQRGAFARGQAPAARLLAALQSMARRPAVLALVQPGTIDDMVHVRAVLAATLPQVEARTVKLRAELGRTRRLRADSRAAAAALGRSRARLEAQRIAYLQLEAAHRARSASLAQGAMTESDRALALGERARDLLDQMGASGAAAVTAAELAALPGPLPRPDASAVPAPAAGFAPAYRLPVAGRVVAGLGEISETGVRSRGLTLACAPGASAAAPAAGRVLYAGPFRGYGGIVIIDHGKGWTSLVAGLGEVVAHEGDRVAQGAPIGRASGGDSSRITVELRRRGVPMDLAQLL